MSASVLEGRMSGCLFVYPEEGIKPELCPVAWGWEKENGARQRRIKLLFLTLLKVASSRRPHSEFLGVSLGPRTLLGLFLLK